MLLLVIPVLNVTASYTGTKWVLSGSVNTCMSACFILSFTVPLLNDGLGYYFRFPLCCANLCLGTVYTW